MNPPTLMWEDFLCIIQIIIFRYCKSPYFVVNFAAVKNLIIYGSCKVLIVSYFIILW